MCREKLKPARLRAWISIMFVGLRVSRLRVAEVLEVQLVPFHTAPNTGLCEASGAPPSGGENSI